MDPIQELAERLDSIATQLNTARTQPSRQVEVLESSLVRVECGAYSTAIELDLVSDSLPCGVLTKLCRALILLENLRKGAQEEIHHTTAVNQHCTENTSTW